MTRPLCSTAAVLCVVVAASSQLDAAGLTLELTDGSKVPVDAIAAVGDSTLTVASVYGAVRIERTLSWERIFAANLEDERYARSELKQALGMPVEETLPTAEPQPANAGTTAVSYAASVEPIPFARESLPLSADCGCDLPVFPPVPYCLSCSPVPEAWLAVRPIGREIGSRPDPLSAYSDLEREIFPQGIPTTEAPFALGLLRERRWLDTIVPIVAPNEAPAAIGPLPPAPLNMPVLAADVLPGKLSQIEAIVRPLRLNGSANVNALGVTIVGLDAAGREVPVDGAAQFTLFAGRQRLVHAFGGMFAADRIGPGELGHWTRQVQPDASLVLRLAEPLPEQDLTVSAFGSLQVRLTMPGSGVFETVAEPILLRPASPLRDAVRGLPE